jgi:hypothetical protein
MLECFNPVLSARRRELSPMFFQVARRSKTVALIACVVAWTHWGGVARAELHTFYFTGQVTSLVDHIGALGPDASGLTTFSGSYTFDSATPPTTELPPGSSEATYQHLQLPAGMIVRMGPFTFRTAPAKPDFRITVRDAYGFAGSDDYQIVSMYNEAEGLFDGDRVSLLDMQWLASTYENDPFSSLAMPTTPPSLTVFGGGDFYLHGECAVCDAIDPTFTVRGVLTSLTSTSTSPNGDLNGDGWTDAADLAMFVGELGNAAGEGHPADLDRDGRIGVADLMLLRAHLTAGGAAPRPESFSGGGSVVPEPSAWVMLAIGTTAMWLAARRRITCA